jgi:hypothetical protein
MRPEEELGDLKLLSLRPAFSYFGAGGGIRANVGATTCWNRVFFHDRQKSARVRPLAFQYPPSTSNSSGQPLRAKIALVRIELRAGNSIGRRGIFGCSK